VLGSKTQHFFLRSFDLPRPKKQGHVLVQYTISKKDCKTARTADLDGLVVNRVASRGSLAQGGYWAKYGVVPTGLSDGVRRGQVASSPLFSRGELSARAEAERTGCSQKGKDMLIGKHLSVGQIEALRYLIEQDPRYSKSDLFRATEDDIFEDGEKVADRPTSV
jgi:hypothetical protein